MLPPAIVTTNERRVDGRGPPMALHTTPRTIGSASTVDARDVATGDSDASLMAALLRREPAAAETLYTRYASRIYGLD